MKTNMAFIKRAAVCCVLLILVSGGIIVTSLHYQLWPHIRWEQVRLHSAIEALGAVAAVAMALVLLDRRRDRPVRFSLVAGFLGMGVLDFFHAACAHPDGLVLLHVLSCLVGATGYLLAWWPRPRFHGRRWILWSILVACTTFGTWVLFGWETLPGVFHDSEGFARAAKATSIVAGTLFLVGGFKFIVDYVRTGEQESFLFLSLALMFGLADYAFASSNLWFEEWWSWHVTRLFGFSLAFAFVVRGYLQNAANLRTSLLEQKKTGRILRKRTRELKQRVKELNCLYRFHKLVEQPGITMDGIFKEVLNILRPSFRYSEFLCARIAYEKKVFKTDNFQESKWTLRRPVECCQAPIGFIEVGYLEEAPLPRGPIFLDEERQLLEAVSEHLSATLQRKRLEMEIPQISTWERQRLGRELHDELSQELTGLGYLAECLRQDLEDRTTAEADVARKLSEGLQVSIGKTRLIAQGQALAKIVAQEFMSSLETIAALAKDRWGVPSRVFARDRFPIQNDSDANQLLRIAQEAIYNAAKHAQASHINIFVRESKGRITVQVRDDGVGISKAEPDHKGLGIHIMQHRANAICAVLSFRSPRSGGTVVTCTVGRRGGNSTGESLEANACPGHPEARAIP